MLASTHKRLLLIDSYLCSEEALHWVKIPIAISTTYFCSYHCFYRGVFFSIICMEWIDWSVSLPLPLHARLLNMNKKEEKSRKNFAAKAQNDFIGMSGIPSIKQWNSWAVFVILGTLKSLSWSFFKDGPFSASFSLFSSFLFNYNWYTKLCWCWDLNHGSLVTEETALPSEPPPLPRN